MANFGYKHFDDFIDVALVNVGAVVFLLIEKRRMFFAFNEYMEEAEHLRHDPVIRDTYKKRKETIERVALIFFCP